MKLECFMCVCCLFSFFRHKTRLFSWLALVVCFCYLVFYFVFFPINKLDKNKHSKKDTPNCFFSVSAVVFTNSVPNLWGVVIRMPKMTKNCSNLEVTIRSKHRWKTGPSMLRNIIGPFLTYENGQFEAFVFCLFLKISFSLQKEEGNKKTKRDKTENLDQFYL